VPTALDDATAETVRGAFETAFSRESATLRQSLTYDQGDEIAGHSALTDNIGIKVYFADKQSPWQRGPIEHAIACCANTCPRAH